MFVRCKKRFKDGKEHRYWSVVENVRVSGGRVVQRQVLYLGEINDSQRAAWCRSIEVVEGASRSRQVALFPEDREAPELDCEVVQVRLKDLTLHDPRQWGSDAVGPSQAGPVLGAALAGEPGRHPMAGHLEDPGLLPTHRPGKRLASSSALVRTQCTARYAGLRPGDCQQHVVSVPGQAGGAQVGLLLVLACALGDDVQRPLRGVALRFDQHVLRVRPPIRGQAPVRPQPRPAPRLRAGGDRFDHDPGRLSVGL